MWLDALDIPLTLALHQFAQENYPEPRQPIQASSEQVGRLYGTTRAPTLPDFPLLHYRWRETLPALQALTRMPSGPDRFDYTYSYCSSLVSETTLTSGITAY